MSGPTLGPATVRDPITGLPKYPAKSKTAPKKRAEMTIEETEQAESNAADARLESQIEDERNSPSALGYVEEFDFPPYEGFYE